MSVELTTFNEGNKTYLAVGFIEDRGFDDSNVCQYRCVDAQGYEFYTDDHGEAMAFISNGLTQPKNTWTLP
ncbi:hypothetical protein BZF66_05630 [Salmonella enterica]|uniref:hypothetical protein n=1 Tax=Salmonella enterica TaxID=28901 RepID=UPI000FDFA8FE|nr:hypothetical protein CPT_Munch_503 [Salmonella phage Munch]EAZ2022772.1 hypothetical protein [Salmonella enterica]ECV9083906.1 hypothetical protein [Salmonella enterica subsp. enterica serovar Infantis]MCP0435496.1 hypothetical protein [Salmonella enterica subsp. enterica serovar Mbandaka]ECC6867546.1 hypothetical protein [Salmonella enterica]